MLLLTELHNASMENTVRGLYLPYSLSVWWIISPYVGKFKESSVVSVYSFELDLITTEIKVTESTSVSGSSNLITPSCGRSQKRHE